MILGTYWYSGFPEALYHFDYFKFSAGRGGFADKPAQLEASIYAIQADSLFTQLEALVNNYPDASLYLYRDGDKLRIGTGGYALLDYDFLFMQQVEQVFKKESVRLLRDDEKLHDPVLIHLPDESPLKMSYPEKHLLQVVSSAGGKYQAENQLLRLDCQLNHSDKSGFIAALKTVAIEARLEVFYYYEQDFGDRSNLMLFFSNGRQGLQLERTKWTDAASLELKIEQWMQRYHAVQGHGSGPYPDHGPRIELMRDEEFVI